MVQRLRPEKYGEGEGALTTTEDDFKLLLLENDWLPFWQPRMVEISYRPLHRTDAKNAYINGDIDRATYVSYAQDNGYKADLANTLADLADTMRFKAVKNHAVMKLYEKNGMSRTRAIEFLKADGYDDDEIAQAFIEVDELTDAEAKAKCVAAVVKKYQAGGLDETELRTQLLRFQLDQTQIESVFRRECLERKSKEKHETASTLCDWYSNGLITPDDFSTRLVALGYNSEDAMNVLSRCNQKISERSRKELEKAKKSAEAAEKAKQAAALKAELKRQDLLKFADAAAKITGDLTSQVAESIRLGMNQIKNQFGYDEDTAYRIAMAVRDRLPKKGPLSLVEWIMQAGAAWPELGPTLTVSAQPPQPATTPVGQGHGHSPQEL